MAEIANTPARKPRKDKKPIRPCSVDGCSSLAKHNELCQLHYGRWIRKGDALWTAEEPLRAACAAEGCGSTAEVRGLCRRHYYRRRAGKPDEPAPKEVKFCTVDGCARRSKRRGLCGMHHARKVARNDVNDAGRSPRRTVISKCEYCATDIEGWRSRRFCNGHCSRRAKLQMSLEKNCSECGVSYPRDGRNTRSVCSDVCGIAKRKRQARECAARKRSTPEGRKRHLESNQRYIESNREAVRSYYRERRRSDPDFRMATAARSMLRKVLERTNRRKNARCVELLGYDGPTLRVHIERQFAKGMTWDRFGTDIHIDHIVPVAEFIRKGVTDPAVINALPNLRPMWAKDNIRKSDKVIALL